MNDCYPLIEINYNGSQIKDILACIGSEIVFSMLGFEALKATNNGTILKEFLMDFSLLGSKGVKTNIQPTVLS